METAEGEVTREAALAALESGAVPLLMLGPHCRIAYRNRAAVVLFAAGRTFHDTGRRLTVQRQVDQDAIEAAVAAAIGSGERAIVTLANRQGDVNHIVTISPSPSPGLAFAILAELRAPLLLRRNWSREALALPPAYAELAEALVGGENLAEFAERTGLTIGGARTRLKKLLRRLAVRSQSDLVALLLRASATLAVR